jgi:hypothetical protein
MSLPILVVAAVVLPFLWGWAVAWLMLRIWPEASTTRAETVESPPLPTDFQI